MAPRNPQGVYLRETATLRHRERFVKRMPPHMSLGLCKQDAAIRSQSIVNLHEESSRIVNFMNHGEHQGEVDLIVKVRYAERVRSASSHLDPIEDQCAARPPYQRVQHWLLKVNADHSAAWTDESRQRQAEESHGRPDVQNTHPCTDVRSENCLGVLKEAPDRIGQKVANPYGAHVVMAHVYRWRDPPPNAGLNHERAPDTIRLPPAGPAATSPPAPVGSSPHPESRVPSGN